MTTYFAIVGPTDELLYEYHNIPRQQGAKSGAQDTTEQEVELRQNLAIGALDFVEARKDQYIANVDYFRTPSLKDPNGLMDYFTAAWIPHSDVRFIVVKSATHPTQAQSAFIIIDKVVARYLSNPFADVTRRIRDENFINAMENICKAQFGAPP